MNIYKNLCYNTNFINEDKVGYKSYLQMDAIMKKLFSIKNPIPIIDFLNSIYGDNISYDAKISYAVRCYNEKAFQHKKSNTHY